MAGKTQPDLKERHIAEGKLARSPHADNAGVKRVAVWFPRRD